MPTVNVYLTFAGDCEDAFALYRSVFGGEFASVMRFKDMPPQDGMPPLPEETGNRIMHVSLRISNETSLMGSDTMGGPGPAFTRGNNFSISVDTAGTAEAERIFNALAAGGTITMPLGMTFWNSYFGMCTDRFGINWMVSHEMPKA